MIPFICDYPAPRGRVLREILRSGVQLAADTFIAAGGRYLLEIVEGGKIHLMAVMPDGYEGRKVAEETCGNGPELMDAIDKLVLDSANAVGGLFAGGAFAGSA